MQIRSLCDAVKCVLLSAPRSRNLAVTRDSFSHQRLPMPISLLRESLSPGKEHCTLVWWDGVRSRSLASARMRAGPRVWEIGRLYLPTLTLPYRHPAPSRRGAQEGGEGEKDLIELLEGLTIYAGSMGAERVLLRVPFDSPVVQMAQRTGFFPYFSQSVLRGSGSGGANRQANSLGLRQKLPHEGYPLFQLYSASTPSSVRTGLGMTFDQWKDSMDGTGHGLREEVYESEGSVTAWLASDFGHCPVQKELMVHPAEVELLPALLDHSLATEGLQVWLVAEYQELLRKLLIHKGFREVGQYCMLIKSMAARAKSPSLDTVEARDWQL